MGGAQLLSRKNMLNGRPSYYVRNGKATYSRLPDQVNQTKATNYGSGSHSAQTHYGQDAFSISYNQMCVMCLLQSVLCIYFMFNGVFCMPQI